jgi:K+-sensing histidine kinase KdpD
MLVALSSRSPNATKLLEKAAELAGELEASLFVLHVKQPMTLHYRREATEHPVPEVDLAYAKRLGASVMIEHGNVAKTLIAFARKMSISYFVTGRSKRFPISFTFQLPLAEKIQRQLPDAIILIV